MDMTLLVKPEPFSQEFDRFFNTLFDAGRTSPRRWIPAMDLVEADDHFVLKADLPGLSEEDISIEIQDATLTLTGERKAEHEEQEKGWHRVERSYGSFSRSLSLPEGVDAEAVTAGFDKGVLSVRIPKPAERKPRRVQIAAGDGKAAVEGSAVQK
jgi:HSP20 family protein